MKVLLPDVAGRPLEVTLERTRGGLRLERLASVAHDEAAAPASRGAVHGVALGDCFSKSVALPPVARRERARTVDVQVDFHLPYPRDAALTVARVEAGQEHTLLHLLATAAEGHAGADSVLPLPVALQALAAAVGALGSGTALAFWQQGASMITVTLEGEEIVFMREFRAPADPIAALRMSSQAVYLRPERSLVEPERVLLLGDARAHGDAIRERLGIEVIELRLERWVEPGTAERLREEIGEAHGVLAVGLALAARSSSLRAWDLAGRSGRWRRRLELGVRAAAIVLPMVLLGTLWATTAINRARIAAFDSESDAVIEQYREVRRLALDVEALEELLAGPGRDLATPRAWQQLLVALERARPDGIWLSRVSGASGERITVSGSADYYGLVIEYLEGLESSAALADLELTSTSSSERGVDFNFNLTMMADGIPEESP